MKNKDRYFLSEFIGSCFLVMIIVGSGLMAENLTDDTAVMLIANTIATGAGLFVLITVFVATMVFDSLDNQPFNVKESYVSLLEILMLTVFGAYFAGRTVEKTRK